MADKQYSAPDTREQAVHIVNAWNNIGAANTYGALKLADIEAALAALDEVDATIGTLEDQLVAARNERQAKRYALWELVKRVRAGAKATHGDNSSEYERFGGTRISERQRHTPETTPTPL